MIDHDSEFFTRIADVVHFQYPDAYVSDVYVSQPSRFPAISIVEMDNSVYLPGRDSGAIENYADVMYQVDVYSDSNIGRKSECRAIMALVDDEFTRIGFARTFMNPVQNMNNPSIYRITARYRAVVSKNNVVYSSGR